jgi:hypothetical protein
MSASNYQNNINTFAPDIPAKMYNKAIDLFSVESTLYNEASISIYICGELRKLKIPYSIDSYGNIIVTKGNAPFNCFCAHLDTVHIYNNGFNLYSYEQSGHKYFKARDNDKKTIGIGGDDKNGIFVCLYLLSVIEDIKVIFFSCEESGGTGSGNINLNVFDDCKFLGGVDRWNGHDFINKYGGNYTISKDFSKDIKPLLKKYDYSFNSGLFTDSFNIMERGINISCFNISCGYYMHHSNNEYIDLNELWNCCLLCAEICELKSIYNHIVPIKHEIKVYNDWTYSNKWNYNEIDDSNIPRCKICDIELLPGEIESGYCYNCQAEGITRRCEICDTELTDNENRFCFDCLELWKDDLREYVDPYELEELLLRKQEINIDSYEK